MVDKFEEIMKDVDARVRDIYEYQVDPNYVLDKVAELEGRSRKKNLRIYGINEEKSEIWEMCETKIKNIFQDKLKIHEDIIIECVHRTKRKTTRKVQQEKKVKSMILRNVHKLKGEVTFL